MAENGYKIALNTIRKIVEANQTIKRPISIRVLTYISDYLTNYTGELTRAVEQHLSEENRLRKVQGLDEKKRLTEDLFKNIIERKNGKNIN